MIKLIFLSRPTIGSKLIRLFTWSRFSHVGIVTPDGTVVEAVPFHGVREIKLEDRLKGTTEVNYRFVEVDDPLGAIERARSQVGKSYDWRGLLGFHRLAFWYCSELVAWACQIRFNFGRVVSPQDLYDYALEPLAKDAVISFIYAKEST